MHSLVLLTSNIPLVTLLFRPLILGLLISISPLTLFAQENDGDNSTVVYPAEYFSEYAPITAQDMLDRIPGQETNAPRRGGGSNIPGGFGGNPSSGKRGKS